LAEMIGSGYSDRINSLCMAYRFVVPFYSIAQENSHCIIRTSFGCKNLARSHDRIDILSSGGAGCFEQFNDSTADIVVVLGHDCEVGYRNPPRLQLLSKRYNGGVDISIVSPNASKAHAHTVSLRRGRRLSDFLRGGFGNIGAEFAG